MTQVSVDPSLLSTFDWFWEQEGFVFDDTESVNSLVNQEHIGCVASPVGGDIKCSLEASSPQVTVPAGCASPPQPHEVEVSNSKTEPQPLAKKRKTWGQELPIPTTNLPPRKRAKTDEEKEQRRIERVLRNRAAAQSSRERKEKQFEAVKEEVGMLVESNADRRALLAALEQANSALREEVEAKQQTLNHYQGYMSMEGRDITPSSAVTAVDLRTHHSYSDALGQQIYEDENPFLYLGYPEVTTTNPIDLTVASGPGGPGSMYTMISTDYPL
ncbi:hypothetical protein HOY80DRAFT_1139453 [Tuber brumale]|nr:hypothetical protein HOY80DRAFT_1139453 [Tuber brumale]